MLNRLRSYFRNRAYLSVAKSRYYMDGHRENQFQGLELLEQRLLYSGVTLITHGFGGNMEVDSWGYQMGVSVALQAGPTSIYRITATDGGTSDSDFSFSGEQLVGDPDTISTGEVIVLFDWQSMAGSPPFGGHHRDTGDIASALVSVLLADSLPGISNAFAERDLHLIGHSRGASLVSALAENLGSHGIWVDHLTLLDPHPVNSTILGSQWNDASVVVGNNVVFSDNYWRADGNDIGRGGIGSDFDGESVSFVYNQQLDEAILDSPEGLDDNYLQDNPDDPAYDNEHSDVHLWYHGTISDSFDGEFTAPDSWYGGSHPVRDFSGYYYSRIAGGSRPADGLESRFSRTNTGITRPAVTLNSSPWANVGNIVLADPFSPARIGETIRLAYYSQNSDPSGLVRLYLDPDRNPYNNNSILIGGESLAVSGANITVNGDFTSIPLSSSIALGEYNLYGAATANGHTRYGYMPGQVSVSAPVPQADLSPENVQVSSTIIDAGSQLSVSFDIWNRGDADAPPTVAAIRLTPEGQGTSPSHAMLGPQINVGSIAPGASIAFSQNVTIPPGTATGTYRIAVVADNGEVLSEGAFSDFGYSENIFVSGIPVVSPTLSGVSPNTLDPDLVTQTVTITGSDFTENTELIFTDPGGTDYLSDPNRLTYDGPTQLRYDIRVAGDEGTWSVRAINAGAPDSNTLTFEVRDTINQSGPVDLFGSLFPLHGSDVDAGDELDVGFTLHNTLSGNSGSFAVGFYLSTNGTISASDERIGSYFVDNLSGGQNRGFSTTIILPASGSDAYRNGDDDYYLGLIVDDLNQVVEQNEGNNRNQDSPPDHYEFHIGRTSSGSSGDIDLFGTYFQVNPGGSDNLQPGQQFLIEFEVENGRNDPTSAFDVEFYISRDNNITTNDEYLGRYQIDSLGGDSSTGRLFTNASLPSINDSYWDAQGDGSYYIAMIVDADDDVEEANESNNSNTGAHDDNVTVYNTAGVTGDYLESNDSFSAASDFGSIEGMSTLTSLSFHTRFDEDFYRFTTAGTGRLAFKILKVDGFVNVRMKIYDSTFQELDGEPYNPTFFQANDWARLSFNAFEGEVYYAKFSLSPTESESYQYDLEIEAPFASLPEDPYEPNDSEATDLGVIDAEFLLDGLTLSTEFDDDKFDFFVPYDGEWEIVLEPVESGRSIGGFLFDEARFRYIDNVPNESRYILGPDAIGDYRLTIIGDPVHYSIRIVPPPAIDTEAPRVSRVSIGSSEWSSVFRQELIDGGQGDPRYVMPTGASQSLAIGWINIDQISLTFDADVSASLDSGDLGVLGENVPLYEATSVIWDPESLTATWILSQPIQADRVLLQLHDGMLTDDEGRVVDGEWIDGSSTVSGDGVAGGVFEYSLNVLPGDISRDSYIGVEDLDQLLAHWGDDVTSSFETLFADLSGDGLVDAFDLAIVLENWGSGALPASPTSNPDPGSETPGTPGNPGTSGGGGQGGGGAARPTRPEMPAGQDRPARPDRPVRPDRPGRPDGVPARPVDRPGGESGGVSGGGGAVRPGQAVEPGQSVRPGQLARPGGDAMMSAGLAAAALRGPADALAMARPLFEKPPVPVGVAGPADGLAAPERRFVGDGFKRA